jgi:hypothetical protein
VFNSLTGDRINRGDRCGRVGRVLQQLGSVTRGIAVALCGRGRLPEPGSLCTEKLRRESRGSALNQAARALTPVT